MDLRFELWSDSILSLSPTRAHRTREWDHWNGIIDKSLISTFMC